MIEAHRLQVQKLLMGRIQFGGFGMLVRCCSEKAERLYLESLRNGKISWMRDTFFFRLLLVFFLMVAILIATLAQDTSAATFDKNTVFILLALQAFIDIFLAVIAHYVLRKESVDGNLLPYASAVFMLVCGQFMWPVKYILLKSCPFDKDGTGTTGISVARLIVLLETTLSPHSGMGAPLCGAVSLVNVVALELVVLHATSTFDFFTVYIWFLFTISVRASFSFK